MTHLTKEEIKEHNKYFNECKRLQSKIVLHDKYEYFSNHLKDYEYSILYRIGQAESYNDLPNLPIIKLLKQIQSRMLKY